MQTHHRNSEARRAMRTQLLSYCQQQLIEGQGSTEKKQCSELLLRRLHGDRERGAHVQ